MMAVIESPGNSPDNYVAWLESVGSRSYPVQYTER